MNYYYAVFRKTKQGVEVEFPDLEGCVTFGNDWEDALDNAKDVLAGWLAHAEAEFIRVPSKHHKLEHLKGELVPVPVDGNMIASYQQLKRFNVIFPMQILKQVDAYRKQCGLKRSTFLLRAAEDYLRKVKTT